MLHIFNGKDERLKGLFISRRWHIPSQPRASPGSPDKPRDKGASLAANSHWKDDFNHPPPVHRLIICYWVIVWGFEDIFSEVSALHSWTFKLFPSNGIFQKPKFCLEPQQIHETCKWSCSCWRGIRRHSLALPTVSEDPRSPRSKAWEANNRNGMSIGFKQR